MSDPDLIDDYVARLRRFMGWRADAPEILAEIEDHLREAASRAPESGDAAVAQRSVLERFGAPATVARSFALTRWGGLAMPTVGTRGAGLAAIIAGGLWALLGVVIGGGRLIGGLSESWWQFTVVIIIVAAGCTIAAVCGMAKRIGLSDIGVVTIVCAGIAWFVSAFVDIRLWAGVSVALSALMLPLVLRWRAVTRGSGWGWAAACAFPIGAAIAAALALTRVSPYVEYGDNAGTDIGLVTTLALLTVGLVAVGRSLRREAAAEPLSAGDETVPGAALAELLRAERPTSAA